MLFSSMLTCRKELFISDNGLLLPAWMIDRYGYQNKKGNNFIILVPISNSGLYHNSFVPMIQVKENADGETLTLMFSLMKPVRIIILVITFVVAFLEICLLSMWMQGTLLESFLVVIPIAILVFLILLGQLIFRSVVNNIRTQIAKFGLKS